MFGVVSVECYLKGRSYQPLPDCPVCRVLLDIALARGDVAKAIEVLARKTEAA
mgnify:CR=1 FL=1